MVRNPGISANARRFAHPRNGTCRLREERTANILSHREERMANILERFPGEIVEMITQRAHSSSDVAALGQVTGQFNAWANEELVRREFPQTRVLDTGRSVQGLIARINAPRYFGVPARIARALEFRCSAVSDHYTITQQDVNNLFDAFPNLTVLSIMVVPLGNAALLGPDVVIHRAMPTVLRSLLVRSYQLVQTLNNPLGGIRILNLMNTDNSGNYVSLDGQILFNALAAQHRSLRWLRIQGIDLASGPGISALMRMIMMHMRLERLEIANVRDHIRGITFFTRPPAPYTTVTMPGPGRAVIRAHTIHLEGEGLRRYMEGCMGTAVHPMVLS
jgi:hypothetical protein